MRISRRLVALLPLALSCAAATAQLNWRQAPFSTQNPPARQSAAMAFDHALGGLLLFGGNNWTGNLGDTWIRQAGAWQQLTPAQSPPARYGPELASDSLRNRIVLFGGMDGGFPLPGVLGDTWEWDGVNWTQQNPALSPAARSGHAMTFDTVRGRVLLFGGNSPPRLGPPLTPGTFFRDTWEWDGVQWTLRSPAVQPPSMVNEQMVFDVRRGRAVLANGSAGTWEWDGTNWMQTSTAGPPFGTGAEMAYDPTRDRVVRYAGADNNGNPLPIGVWDYDGRVWVNRTTATNPPLRYWTVLGFDPATETLVTFGGRDASFLARISDTWILFPVNPATASAFGTGCAGSGGVLQLAAENRPWLGDSFRLRWTGLPAGGALVMLALGASDQTWVGTTLPLPLGSLGMTGCSLFVSLDAIATTTAAAGTFVTPLPVPANTSLVGSDVFLQAFAFDPAANPGGMSASNGVAARIGSR